MARIVVLDGYTVNPGDADWSPIAALGELVVYDRSDPELVVERARGADVVITNKTRLGERELSLLEGVRGVCVFATGFDVVDAQAAKARGIVVCNAPDYSTPSVVEHTFALIFALIRRVELHSDLVFRGEWSRAEDFCFWKTPQGELRDRVLGVVGYGSIGSRVASVGLAFGMRVLATPSSRREPEAGVESTAVDDLFRRADIVTLHCPLTPKTQGLVSAERLERMRSNALLINTARGALVCEPELASALRSGVIAGAALDSLSSEPPAREHPLLSAVPNLIVTPHLAWTSLAARKRLIAVTAENVAGILARTPVNAVNL